MLRAILFDNDGILVDTEKLYYQANRQIMLDHGMDLSHEEYFQFFLKNNCGMWHLLASKGISQDDISALRNKRNEHYTRMLHSEDIAIPDAEKVLQSLKGRFKIGVVTSSLRRHFDIIHERTGFLEYFDFIVAEGDYTSSKPDPEPYLVAMQRSGFQPQECLAIEDSPRGLLAAKAAGLACWAIPSELTRSGDFSSADKTLSSLAELPARLQQR